ncbi:MAG: ATP-binding cassette domain-containing protein [Deltaproteobacteria bacterium]|nr:ATP-binding cassette domain-containing protein [Deltaproteobacteria bacterium]
MSDAIHSDAPQSAAPAMIALRGVRKVFPGPAGPVVAVDDLDVSVPKGEVLCIIGTSGCGKTTTMKMINRLVEPTAGTITVGGRDVRDREVTALRREIGYVIQRGGLFPHMTVAANISVLCRLERWEPERIERRVTELLALVNLPADEFAGRYPRELSGGQCQRVGVARALALDPAIVLMDEPCGALDPITRTQLHTEFTALRTAMAKTIVMVTHDLHEAFTLGDRVALMDAGRIVQLGTEEDFVERPASSFVESFVRDHRRGAHA